MREDVKQALMARRNKLKQSLDPFGYLVGLSSTESIIATGKEIDEIDKLLAEAQLKEESHEAFKTRSS